jgi:hypothetical protein
LRQWVRESERSRRNPAANAELAQVVGWGWRADVVGGEADEELLGGFIG